MPFIIQFALDVFSCFMFTTTIYCNLMQARKLAKNTRNVSSTSSTQRPQRTGNDNVGARLIDILIKVQNTLFRMAAIMV